jgi:hypothetical protein
MLKRIIQIIQFLALSDDVEQIIEESVFKEQGGRWSFKNLRIPCGIKVTSFYHYPTKQDAKAAATEAWNDYTGDNIPVNYYTE